MSTSLTRLGVVFVLGACAGACTSYHRSLGEDEPTPARRDIEADRVAAPPSRRPKQPEPVGFKTAFPSIRVDTDRRLVEFDARVSPLIFEPYEGRNFYLEQYVCKVGTKDHESLVVTDALPSQIHAALLLVGLQPGAPVSWTYPDGNPVVRAARGPVLDVRFVLTGDDGKETIVDPRDWTVTQEGSGRVSNGTWVFAGSNFAGPPDAEFYEADAAGTIVGLAGFGTEVIAWGTPISHEEAQGQLEWTADLEAIPPAGTSLIVRLRPLAR